MNIPTSYFEASVEQVVMMSKIISKNEDEEEKNLNMMLIGKSMYEKIEDKETFLRLSEKEQNKIIVEYSKLLNEKVNEEKTEQNNKIINEKPFYEKYLILIIVGIILFFLLIIILII
jgi:hypothetical protein